MREHYVKATLALLKEGTPVPEVVAGLRRTLATHSHEQLFAGVLRVVLRRLEDGVAGSGTRVFVAKAGDNTALATTIATYLKTLLAGEANPTLVEDHSLVGGVVVEHNYTRIDASYKRALRELYERVTA